MARRATDGSLSFICPLGSDSLIRLLAITLSLLVFATMTVAAIRVGAEPRTIEFGAGQGSDTKGAGSLDIPRPTTVGLYRGHTARYYDAKFRGMRHLAYIRHKRIKQLKRTLLARPSVAEAINLAATVYGNGSTLWQLARCESRLDPHARNPSSSTGLFQILYPATWRTTPFSGLDRELPAQRRSRSGLVCADAGT